VTIAVGAMCATVRLALVNAQPQAEPEVQAPDPEGGRIGLTVEAPEDGETVRFTVWDTGIGIAAEDGAKLFHAFTQIDSGLSRAQEGTGLGLALVAKLVELHGGSVTLDSEPGRGSRFVVTLPRQAPSTARPAAKPNTPPGPGMEPTTGDTRMSSTPTAKMLHSTIGLSR